MKKSLFAFLLIFALLFTAFSAVPASAADKATVVYLKDDGKGDGSSPENAVSDLFDAYDALDLSKDCTVVVCGPFLQEFEFSYGEEYAGSVTFTSVYGGVDYRKSGAVYQANQEPACRFVCWGETTFEQIDINLIHAARTLGMSEFEIFTKVTLPSASPGVISGTILTFARAMGEYGATSMLAGNIPGKTSTVSQRIAMVLQDGDYATAGIWVAVVMVIAFICIFSINFILTSKQKHIRRW